MVASGRVIDVQDGLVLDQAELPRLTDVVVTAVCVRQLLIVLTGTPTAVIKDKNFIMRMLYTDSLTLTIFLFVSLFLNSSYCITVVCLFFLLNIE